jgi:LytS/YehU family sensor histidine kinase
MLKNKGDEAALYLDKFATLMRLNLNNSRESFIPLSDDIKALELNLELEQLRFSGKFDFRIIVDGNIEPERTYIPPMLAQPYTENSILHGLSGKKGKEHIEITYSKVDKSILCVIEDNGIGREASGKLKKERKRSSLGMKLTHERLELLKKELGLDISVNIKDLKNDSGEPAGTRVELKIPFEEE